MASPDPSPTPFVEDSLHFEYVEGAVANIGEAHNTGWRELPFSICAQIKEGRVRLDLGDGSSREVGGGQAFIVQAGVRNLVEKISQRPLVSRFAHFRLSVLSTVDALDFYTTPLIVAARDADRLGDFCERLAQLEHDQGASLLRRKLEQKAVGFELAAAIADLSSPREEAMASMGVLSRLAPVFRALHEDLAGRYALDDLAQMVHLSPSRFHALFKKTVGVPPLEYLQRLRLDMAKRLLLESDLGVAQIASRVGYADPFHFSRTFKRRAGLSPRHYRDEVRGGLWSAGQGPH